jgi:perosamine synthetase
VPQEVLAAVRRVVGASAAPIALHEPEFAGREWDYVKECLDTCWVSSVGAFVDRFERASRRSPGVSHAVATSNGTSALHVCRCWPACSPATKC